MCRKLVLLVLYGTLSSDVTSRLKAKVLQSTRATCHLLFSFGFGLWLGFCWPFLQNLTTQEIVHKYSYMKNIYKLVWLECNVSWSLKHHVFEYSYILLHVIHWLKLKAQARHGWRGWCFFIRSCWTGNEPQTAVSLCSVALKPCCRTIPEMIKRGKWKVTSCHVSWSLGWNVRPAGPWGWHPPYTNALARSEWRQTQRAASDEGGRGGSTGWSLAQNTDI